MLGEALPALNILGLSFTWTFFGLSLILLTLASYLRAYYDFLGPVYGTAIMLLLGMALGCQLYKIFGFDFFDLIGEIFAG